MSRAILIAGMASGVGKTTFSSGIVRALRNKGYTVQPFKTGPDYLDPTYLTQAASRITRNLDTFMLPSTNLLELFNQAASQVDICVIEGMSGLYDGKDGLSEEGSTAALAKLLGIPVLAVLDIGKVSRTAGAHALGLKLFDPALNLVGFLLNNAGSPTHARWVQESIEATTNLPVIGWLPSNNAWALPERHLGLVPAGEDLAQLQLETKLEALAEQIVTTVNLEQLDRLIRSPQNTFEISSSKLFPDQTLPARVRLGLAQDAAFGFYYQDSLDLLRAWGAEIVPFSPLFDEHLPADLDGLYIGGGFPEVFARELTANTSMRQSIAEAVSEGLPVYAECGGLMYLCQELIDFDGTHYPMVGVLPNKTIMQSQRVKIWYAEVEAAAQHTFLAPSQRIRGHEFHWSQLEHEFERSQAAYLIPSQNNQPEGWVRGNVIASYIHLHFGSNEKLAPQFVRWLEKS